MDLGQFASMRPRGQTPWMPSSGGRSTMRRRCFNEATGADPVDAVAVGEGRAEVLAASMRPRGQTPWMRGWSMWRRWTMRSASMRPRGQTPWMLDVAA